MITPFAPRQSSPSKAWPAWRSWRYMQFSSASAPSLYLNTAPSAPQREITSGIQVRNARIGDHI